MFISESPKAASGGASEYILDTSLEQEEILVVKRVAVVAHPYVTAVELHTEIFIQIPVYAKRQVFFLTTIDSALTVVEVGIRKLRKRSK